MVPVLKEGDALALVAGPLVVGEAVNLSVVPLIVGITNGGASLVLKPSEEVVEATYGGREIVSPGFGREVAEVGDSVVVNEGFGKLNIGVVDTSGSLAVNESMALIVAVIVPARFGIASAIPSQIV